MAHSKNMKNVRIESALVDKAKELIGQRYEDLGLEKPQDKRRSGGSSYWSPSPFVSRIDSTTRAVSALLELGLRELARQRASQGPDVSSEGSGAGGA